MTDNKPTVFVPNGDSRRETAILLVGTADEQGFSQSEVKAVNKGFLVSERVADALAEEVVREGVEVDSDDEEYDEFVPSDYKIEQVKDFVTEHPDTAEDVLRSEQAGENRATLVKWLTDTINKQNTSEEE